MSLNTGIGELLGDQKIFQDIPDDQPSTEKYKKYRIVSSTTAYLIGAKENLFGDEQSQVYDPDIFREMEKQKKAKIIRSLSMIRNDVERNFGKIVIKMRDERLTIISMPDLVQDEPLKYLSENYINLYSACKNPTTLLIEVNKQIMNRINNCRDLYPAWVSWDYLKKIFIMPNGTTEEGTKAAGEYYHKYYDRFPHHLYISWEFHDDEDAGNILYSDSKFVPLLYRQNGDEFTDHSKISDVSEKTKTSIHDFIKYAGKVVALVD